MLMRPMLSSANLVWWDATQHYHQYYLRNGQDCAEAFDLSRRAKGSRGCECQRRTSIFKALKH